MSDYADQTVAVLAVQGAFAEQEARLSELGAHCIELRQAADLQQNFDRLVLPGGESTVQGKLLAELDMLEDLRTRIVEGMPVLGTCAGLILLARDLAAHDDKGTPRLATMDILVERTISGGAVTPATANSDAAAFSVAGASNIASTCQCGFLGVPSAVTSASCSGDTSTCTCCSARASRQPSDALSG